MKPLRWSWINPVPSCRRRLGSGVWGACAHSQPSGLPCPILKPSTPFLTGANLSSSLRRRLGLAAILVSAVYAASPHG